jgi:PAS domain S-box-containing protein
VVAGIVAFAIASIAVLLCARRARTAVAAAEQARARYEAVCERQPDVAILAYDRDLRYTALGGSLTLPGWRREDIEGRLITEVVPADLLTELLPHCEAALRGESSQHDWAGTRVRSRRYRTAHHPLLDASGAVAGGMMMVRDITAAEQLRREAETSRGFIAGVLEQLSDRVIVCDADGRLHLFGDAADDAPAGPLDWPGYFELYRADGRTPLTAAEVPLFRALQGEAVTDAELTVGRPGPDQHRILMTAHSVTGAGGQALGAVATWTDVTDRRDTEARLRASEARYRSVIESVGDIVFQTDLQGRWAFMNESWSRWSGYPIEEGLGRPAHELVHPEDRAAHARAFTPLIAGEVDSVLLRHRYLTAEGVTRWAEVRASLARDAAGRPLGVAGVIEDVTERHRTKQYEAAEQAVIDVLAHAQDIEGGVVALLEVLCRHLDWDLAELWTLDAGDEVLRCTDAWGERRGGLEVFEAARDGETFEVGDGLQGQAWARRSPIWATGLDEDPLFRRGEDAAAAGLQSALALPVFRGGFEVLATILFFSREQREPDPALARLLQTIGAHLAQFLQRRRAERELAERAAEVHELAKLISELQRV